MRVFWQRELSVVVLLLSTTCALLASAQDLPLTRPPRPPRVAGETPPPPPPPADPLQISTSSLASGIQGAVYPTATLTTANGFGPFTWVVTAGTLPAGLTLGSTEGTISGTPTAAGAFSFTLRATDAFGRQASRSFVLIISSNSSSYGNTGNAYATEGGAPNPAATVLTTCPGGFLSANTSYRLGQNLTAATPGTVCFTLSSGTKVDLGGFTITGRVSHNANGGGVVVFNGTINCNWVENGSDAGCLRINAFDNATVEMRIHHLTLSNTAAPSRALHIGWNMTTAPTTFRLRVYNITATVLTQLAVTRSSAITLIGTNQKVEFFDNDLTCNGDANACQGIMCFAVADCKMHHNRITLMQNTTSETARGLLLDGNTLAGEVWNNLIIANNNRAIRVRDSRDIRIHDNSIKSITTNPSGTFHLADPDGALVNDLNVLVDNNDFELAGGNLIFLRNGFNAVVRDNRFSCVGSCSSSKLAVVRTPISGGNRSELTLENNLNVILFSSPAQVNVETNAKVNICNSGQTSGSGTVNPTC